MSIVDEIASQACPCGLRRSSGRSQASILAMGMVWVDLMSDVEGVQEVLLDVILVGQPRLHANEFAEHCK